MGFFKKSKVLDEKSIELNRVLMNSLKLDGAGNMIGVPDSLEQEDKDKLVLVIFQVFELIKQLKEGFVYSNKAVHNFVNENFKWVDKKNVERLIELGLNKIN